MLFPRSTNRPRRLAPAPAGRPAVRPSVEALEAREAPAPLPATLSFAGIASSFSLNPFSFQRETVNVAVSNPLTGNGAATGQVTLTDLGQTQTVPVNSSGQASATFTFNIFQVGWLPHTVTANFSDPGGVYSPSAASTSAPNTTGQALPFLWTDAAIWWAWTTAVLQAFNSANSGG